MRVVAPVYRERSAFQCRTTVMVEGSVRLESLVEQEPTIGSHTVRLTKRREHRRELGPEQADGGTSVERRASDRTGRQVAV